MLLKIVSFIASVILMLVPSVALPEKGTVLTETLGDIGESRTADEINGTNGTRFYIQRPETAVFTNIEITSNTFTDIPSVLMRTNNVNGLVFSGNTVDTGEFFDSNNVQGRIQMSEYCSNVTYSENSFFNGGFLDNKK